VCWFCEVSSASVRHIHVMQQIAPTRSYNYIWLSLARRDRSTVQWASLVNPTTLHVLLSSPDGATVALHRISTSSLALQENANNLKWINGPLAVTERWVACSSHVAHFYDILFVTPLRRFL
jgi:hypothetical protein